MSIYGGLLSGRGKQSLTRADVEELLRQAGSSENLRLAGEDISGSNLGGLYLSGADLSDALLSNTNLINANLSRADLSNTNLSSGILINANLSRADLRYANLSNANLSRADLSNANLSNANLSNATNLSGANLSGADLSRANLSGADLSGADLSRDDLSRAGLSGANLGSANLSGTNLSSAILSGADLSGANLSGANLNSAILIETNLSGANLSGANLSSANLVRANLSSADLTRVRILDTTFTLSPDLLQNLKMTTALQESEKLEKGVGPVLRLRIQEESLTIQHLSATLDAFKSLYTKMWLLQQERFDDFVRYTEHRDRRFEEEANLLISELKYNSPLNIKFPLPNPKSLVEALQMLVDIIPHSKLRKQGVEEEIYSKKLDNQLKEEVVKKERLNNADHMLETMQRAAAMVEKLSPGLDKERKDIAVQSLMKDILQLAGDQTLEVSLLLPSTVPQQQNIQVSLQEQASSVQASAGTINTQNATTSGSTAD